MNTKPDSFHLAAGDGDEDFRQGRASSDAAPSAGKRVYAVRVSKETVAMVLAEGEDEAAAFAESNAHEILRDCPQDVIADVVDVVRAQVDLSGYGWDEMCLPYGGDGNTRLSEILPLALPAKAHDASGSPASQGQSQVNKETP